MSNKEKRMRQLIFNQFLSKIYKIFFSINFNSEELKINEKTRCLVLASCASNELIGCGGLMLKNPQNFDVYALTNGFKAVQGTALSYEEKIALRKKEFLNVMEKANVNYYHFFEDIDDKRLIMRYDRFKTISLSDYDYIFIPNILDKERDNKAIAIMLKELLKERPYKKTVKIVMYENFSNLAMPNAFVNIEDTAEAKFELLKSYKSLLSVRDFIPAIKSLNQYNGYNADCELAENYCVLNLNNFNKICRMYKI